MKDDQDIRGTLDRLAAGHPLDPMDSGRLLERGRRGRRRRRWSAAGSSSLAAVSVVALVATISPGPDAPTTEIPPPAGSPSRTAKAPGFTPLPGVPGGDQALDTLTAAEVVRRCQLRGRPLWNHEVLGNGRQATGSTVFTMKLQERDRTCSIPGDSRPSKALIAAASADPVPADDAGRLRNCSVKIWHDLTRWRVMAKDTQPGVGTNLVALSPSGRYVLFCTLTARGQTLLDAGSTYLTSKFRRTSMQGPPIAGHQTCGNRQPCLGYLFSEAGRVTQGIARIRLTAKNGRTHDLKVNDGWYALAWGDRDPNGPDLTVTKYDASGRVVG